MLFGEISASFLTILLDFIWRVAFSSTLFPTCFALFFRCASGAALIALTSLLLVLLLAFALLTLQYLPKDRLCHNLVHLLLKVGDLVRWHDRANFSLWSRSLDDHTKFFVLVF